MSLRARRPVLVAALAAGVLGLGVRLAVAAGGRDLPPDGAVDLEVARDLLAGRSREAVLRKFHPLAGALEAGVARVLGREPDPTCGLLVSLAAGALVPVAVALAAALLVAAWEGEGKESARGNRRFSLAPEEKTSASLAAGVIAAVHPHLASSAATVFNYPLAHAALAGALVAALAAIERGRARAFLAAGAAAGLGYLARPDGLVLGAGVAAGLAVAGSRRGFFARPIAGRASGVVLVALAMALVGAPHVAAIHAATGEWRLTLKKDARHLVGEVDPNAAASIAPAASASRGLGGGREAGACDFGALLASVEQPLVTPAPAPVAPDRDLGRAALYALRKTSEAAHPLVLVLALAGLWAARRSGRAHAPGLAIVAAFLGAHTLLRAHEGYLARQHAVGEATVFAVEAGVGVAWLARLAAGRSGVRERAALSGLLGVSALVLLPPAFQGRAARKSAGERAAADLVRAQATKGRPLVVAGEGSRPVAVLAGGDFVPLERGDARAVVAGARREGASFIVLFVRTHGDAAAGLARIDAALRDAGVGSGKRFREVREDADGGVIVYTWLVYATNGGP